MIVSVFSVEIEKSIVCPTLRFFYDKKGNIIEEKLTELLRDIPQSVSFNNNIIFIFNHWSRTKFRYVVTLTFKFSIIVFNNSVKLTTKNRKFLTGSHGDL